MRKIYRYRDIEFPVDDHDNVFFEVVFVSDGNMAYTVVNVPGDHDPELADEGMVFLGKGSALRNDTTISFSDVENPVPQEDTISIQYKINGKLLVEHSNPKSVTERPYIILFIKFPLPV
jgi:hypothetical protein